jgi:hypothetical protein
MCWVAQPYQGLGMKLARPLAAQPQGGTNLAIEGRDKAVQAITGEDDVPQTRGQALEQRVKGMPHLNCFPNLGWVWRR